MSKKCPNCRNNIEKNGGCNHMCCSSCHFHFCWMCMGKFGDGPLGSSSGYSTHQCNVFKEEDSKIKLDKDDWERFRWYAERYNTHVRSLKLEEKLKGTIDDICSQLQEKHALSSLASKFYVDAVSELIISRNIMSSSYIFGYYRAAQCPEIHKELFEHRQNELERHTEMLSNCIGENPDAIRLVETRTQVINATRLVASSSRALLDVALNAIVEKKKTTTL